MATREAQRDNEEEIAEENPFVLVDRIQEHGVNAGDIARLKAAGCFTVENLIFRTRKDLCSIKGVSEAKCDKIIDAAKKLSSLGFMTGTEFAQKRSQMVKVTTGCKAIDTMLGGGIETQSITEIFGEFRTGKTQICHTLCVTTQLPEELGGGNGKVAYIDTEGTFRPERIHTIAERFGVDPEAILENIAIARAYNHEHLMSLVVEIAARMVEDPYRLLIVDSGGGIFRTDFSGRGELAERQQKLCQFLARLLKLSREFDLAVVITNQMVSDPGGALFIANSAKPMGGNIMAHASTTRLSLRKGRGEQRIMKIYDSPSLPESEAIFQIANGGITDASD